MENIVRTLSSYQIGYLKSLFAQSDLPKEFSLKEVKVEFIGLCNGDLIVGYIQNDEMNRENISRYPKYKIPPDMPKRFPKLEESDTTK